MERTESEARNGAVDRTRQEIRSRSGVRGPAVGPSRWDVVRAKQRNTFTTTPSITTATFQSFSHSNELLFIPYNSPLRIASYFIDHGARGWSHGEADVIVHPDWTGPSCGPPSWAGSHQRPSRPAHTTCLGLGWWKPRWNCHSERQDSDSENESLGRRSSRCGKRGEGASQTR